MARSTRVRRGIPAALTAVLMALPLIAGTTPAQALPPPDTTGSGASSPYRMKTDARVAARLDALGAGRDGGKGVTFWVTLTGEANTSEARAQRAKAGKARMLHKIKRAHARKTQAPLTALLRNAGAPYESFWIANTVKVTGDKALAQRIAARPEVAALEADDSFRHTDPPKQGRAPKAATGTVEWNIDRIGAPKVWSQFGVRGEGAVVATIQAGVDHTHPDLSDSYRGRKADGTHDHAYNWYDATGVCTGGEPCDNTGAGTLQTGIMTGGNSSGSAIGAAPGAKWIAAKGCATDRCYRDELLRAAQWLAAPTDPSGANPRPDLAPDVVNNAWSGTLAYSPWFKTVIQSWRDAGIFPSFDSGNTGGCSGSTQPGAYSDAYSTGGFDRNNIVTFYSGRGNGENGAIKPDITAPGVDIRSAFPGGGHWVHSGTQPASAHTAAAVALIYSAAPSLRGNVTETEKLLGRTAIDTDDTRCGGTATRNNSYGEGRLDVHAAVAAAPRGPLGTGTGTVASAAGPIAGATLDFTGAMKAQAVTDASGTWTAPRLMTGDYTVTATAFGHVTATASLTVTENGTTVRNFTLAPAPAGRLTGKVTGNAGGEAGATVTVRGAALTTTSAADGSYTLPLPAGAYELLVTPAHGCAETTAIRADVAASGPSGTGTVKNLALRPRTDGRGTTCSVAQGEPFPQGVNRLQMKGSNPPRAEIDLPFPVSLYGVPTRKLHALSEGMLAFTQQGISIGNNLLPHPGDPSATLYPFWDSLTVAHWSDVYWSTTGTAPHRKVTVEWRNLVLTGVTPEQRITFAAVVGEDGSYSFHYKDIGATAAEKGASATVGVEDHESAHALVHSFNKPVLRDGMSIHFRPAPAPATAPLR
ncbi:S8 family serine peptidase [Streptomyces sp. CAU 1734]|uniref:S8 family serine peptidase n=1 Tax=Streptomyces sp. CAU 1734 TaxID=3140360 RepID=UPI003260645B